MSSILTPLFGGNRWVRSARTAVKVLRFVERAVGFANDLAKMHKMNARSKLTDHDQQVIVWAGAVRTCAKGKAVRGAVNSVQNETSIGGRRNYTGQAEEGPRRIIGMNGKFEAVLFRHRCDFLKESSQS